MELNMQFEHLPNFSWKREGHEIDGVDIRNQLPERKTSASLLKTLVIAMEYIPVPVLRKMYTRSHSLNIQQISIPFTQLKTWASS